MCYTYPQKNRISQDECFGIQKIANDLQDGIDEYEKGRIGNAVFEWHFGVLHHWGDHAVDAI